MKDFFAFYEEQNPRKEPPKAPVNKEDLFTPSDEDGGDEDDSE